MSAHNVIQTVYNAKIHLNNVQIATIISIIQQIPKLVSVLLDFFTTNNLVFNAKIVQIVKHVAIQIIQYVQVVILQYKTYSKMEFVNAQPVKFLILIIPHNAKNAILSQYVLPVILIMFQNVYLVNLRLQL